MALMSRPDLAAGMQNPKIQDAIGLFQTNPAEAKRKYENDTEVSKFMTEFSKLMGTHFENIAADEAKHGKNKNPAQNPAAASSTTPHIQPASDSSTEIQAAPELNLSPELQADLQDPNVMQLIEAVEEQFHKENFRVITPRSTPP